MPGAIFISYRREDSIANAGRLYDHLSAEFGRDRVFMDVDAIEPGQDFVEVIQSKVGSCSALVAVIGQEWLTVADARGRRRLDDAADYVVLEIRAALERKIPVIPVLVGSASPPKDDDLPDAIKSLARRQALTVNDTDFRTGVGKLIDVLKRSTARGRTNADGRPVEASPQSRSSEAEPGLPPDASTSHAATFQTEGRAHDTRRLVLMVAALAAALLLLVFLLLPRSSGNPVPAPATETNPTTVSEITATAPQVPSPSATTRPAPSARAQEQPLTVPARETPDLEAQRQELLRQTLANVGRQPNDELREAAAKLKGGETSADTRNQAVTPATAPARAVRVGGTIREPVKTKDVRPVYPPIALSARVQGVVIVEATIGSDGKVTDARVVRSIPLLDQGAVEAVRQWEYSITYVNGVPTPVVMTVTVSFGLN